MTPPLPGPAVQLKSHTPQKRTQSSNVPAFEEAASFCSSPARCAPIPIPEPCASDFFTLPYNPARPFSNMTEPPGCGRACLDLAWVVRSTSRYPRSSLQIPLILTVPQSARKEIYLETCLETTPMRYTILLTDARGNGVSSIRMYFR